MLVACITAVGSLAGNAQVGRIGLPAGVAAFTPRVKPQAFQQLAAAAHDGPVAAQVVCDPVAFFFCGLAGGRLVAFDDFANDVAQGGEVVLLFDFTIGADGFLVEQATAFAGVEVQLGAVLAGHLLDALVFAVVPVFFALAMAFQGFGQVVAGPAGEAAFIANQVAVGVVFETALDAVYAFEGGQGVGAYHAGAAGGVAVAANAALVGDVAQFVVDDALGADRVVTAGFGEAVQLVVAEVFVVLVRGAGGDLQVARFEVADAVVEVTFLEGGTGIDQLDPVAAVVHAVDGGAAAGKQLAGGAPGGV